MGISGLLPLLKSITDTKTIDQYIGQTLAIDGYCWLHRAIYCCSQEICLGEPTDKYILYFIDRINALLQHGITPYVVFDGGPLPMKKGTEDERRKSRAKNRELGIQSLRQKNYTEARKYFVRAADVSPFMAHRVIQRLKLMNVQYVVAPYEADAQLAYLMKHGLVDGVITEDSDCIPFGCSKVLFKMDRDGVAQEVCAENLKHNTGMSFHMFSDQMFLEMCIFSGCDYLASLPGFALKKAYTLMKQHGSFTKILRAIRMEGKVRVPPTYEAEFERAILTFRHQRVFDPATKKLVPLTPIPAEHLAQDPAMKFLGPIIPHEDAQAIAEGDMDPITRTIFAPAPPSAASIPANAARSVYIKPPTTTAPVRAPVRSLPGWMSRKASQLAASAPPPPPPPAPKRTSPVSTTPKTISHFFASRSAKHSPQDDSTKATSAPAPSLSRQHSTESTYESQDAVEIDVARSISFAPTDDETKQLHRAEKENTSPNAEASELTEPATDDAFARMMRAGSALQKYALKRKAPLAKPSSTYKFGRFGGIASARQHHASPVDQIKRHAFSQSTTEEANEREPRSQCEATTFEPESEPDASEESQVDDSSQSCITRSSLLSDKVSLIGTETTVARVVATSGSDAFARFRFGTK